MKKYDINKQRVPSWDRYEQLYLQTTLTPEEQVEFENLRDNVINIHSPNATEWNELVDDRDAVVDAIATNIPELAGRGDYVEKSVERLLLVNDNIVSATPTSLNSNKIYTDFVNNMDYSIGNIDALNYNFNTSLSSGSLSMVTGNIYTYDFYTLYNSGITTSQYAPVRVLENGWIVSCMLETSSSIMLRISKNKGVSWTTVINIGTSGAAFFSMTTYQNIIYVLNLGTTNGAVITKVDPIAVTQSTVFQETSFTATDGGHINANPSTGVISACYSIKNATYPNSTNIKFTKSINGTSWTKQDGTAGVDQITAINTANFNMKTPVVEYLGNENPIISCSYMESTGKMTIHSYRYTTSWQANVAIYTPTGTYFESRPYILKQRYGANVGRVWVSWDGRDGVNTANNVKIKYSDDLGATWVDGGSNLESVTTGNTYDYTYTSLCEDEYGDIYVIFNGTTPLYPSITNVQYIKRASGTWGSIVYITNLSTANLYPATCNNLYTISKPLMIYRSTGSGLIKLNGKWSEGSIPQFKKGQEVTIQQAFDSYAPESLGTTYEEILVDRVDGAIVYFQSPIVNSYSKGSVFRSCNNGQSFGQINGVNTRRNVIRLSINNPNQFKNVKMFFTSYLLYESNVVFKIASLNASLYDNEVYTPLDKNEIVLSNGDREITIYNTDFLAEKPNLVLKIELIRTTEITASIFKSLLGSLNNTVASATDRWILNSDDFAQPLINYVWDDSAIWDDDAIWKD